MVESGPFFACGAPMRVPVPGRPAAASAATAEASFDNAGRNFVHDCIDGRLRCAYAEFLADDWCKSTTGFRHLHPRWLRNRSVSIAYVMTDNGAGYHYRVFAKACRITGPWFVRTRP